MRARYAFVIAVLSAACGPKLRRDVVNQGGAAVALRGQPAAAPATIQLARGRYEIALRWDVPRSQVVDYELTCGGLPIARGQAGETFEAYRTRRIAQLRQQADQDRRAAAAVTSTVVGAVAPNVRVQGAATAPGASATASGEVSGQAAGAAAGQAVAQAQPEIHELPYGDVGAGHYKASAQAAFGVDVTCTLSSIADDPTVYASYQVVQVRDLDAEARERRIAANASAQGVRRQLTAQLQVAGADPWALQKRREAEARARAEAQAERDRVRLAAQAERDREQAERDRVRLTVQAEADLERAKAQAERDRVRLAAEADAERARANAQAERDRAQRERTTKIELEANLKIQIQLKREQRVRHTRTLLVAYLEGECHADPHKVQREREARELKVRIDLEARADAEARLRAEREARDAKLRIELEARADADARTRGEREAREARIRAEREAREAKLRAEREAREQFARDERAAREARERGEREARAAVELEQQRAAEALELQRVQVALNVRAGLRAYLVGIGARERPPMPALLVEAQGTAPFDGAVWIAGNWRWTSGQWVWTAGGWQDSSHFGDSGTVGGAVVSRPVVSVPTGVSVSGTISTGTTGTTTTTSTGTATGSTGATVSGSTSTTIVVPTLPVTIDAGISIGTPARKPATKPATGSGPTVRDHRR